MSKAKSPAARKPKPRGPNRIVLRLTAEQFALLAEALFEIGLAQNDRRAARKYKTLFYGLLKQKAGS